jgi:hypothetical protein
MEQQPLPQDVSTIISLSNANQGAGLALFNGLDTARQAALVHIASPENKKELLFLANSLSELFDKLHGRDVCLALEACTASEFDVLIERIGPSHLNFMLAMGCWRDNDIDPARFLHWLDILNNCNNALAMAAIADIEADFLAAALWPHFEVASLDGEDFEDTRGESEAYAFAPENCRFTNDSVEDFLTGLFEGDRTLFALLCHKRIYANPEEILESARLGYSRRLQQEGLPSHKDAAAVYEKGWEILQNVTIARKDISKAIKNRSTSEPFLTQVWAALNSSGRGGPQLANDFSNLLLRVTVADSAGLDDAARRLVVRKAEIFSSLGLEKLSNGDVELAADLLAKNGITAFFKAGYDMVTALQKRVREIVGVALENEDTISDAATNLEMRAILESAAREIPRIVIEKGKSRMVKNLGEFVKLEERINQYQAK